MVMVSVAAVVMSSWYLVLMAAATSTAGWWDDSMPNMTHLVCSCSSLRASPPLEAEHNPRQ